MYKQVMKYNPNLDKINTDIATDEIIDYMSGRYVPSDLYQLSDSINLTIGKELSLIQAAEFDIADFRIETNGMSFAYQPFN